MGSGRKTQIFGVAICDIMWWTQELPLLQSTSYSKQNSDRPDSYDTYRISSVLHCRKTFGFATSGSDPNHPGRNAFPLPPWIDQDGAVAQAELVLDSDIDKLVVICHTQRVTKQVGWVLYLAHLEPPYYSKTCQCASNLLSLNRNSFVLVLRNNPFINL